MRWKVLLFPAHRILPPLRPVSRQFYLYTILPRPRTLHLPANRDSRLSTLKAWGNIFCEAVDAQNTQRVLGAYKRIRTILTTNPELATTLHAPNEGQLIKAMQTMSQSQAKDEINLVFVMYSDVSTIFMRSPNEHHEAAFLNALISRGWLDQARLRIQTHFVGLQGYKIIVEHLLKNHCAREAIQVLCEACRHKNITLDANMYLYMFEAMSVCQEEELLSQLSNSVDCYVSKRGQRKQLTKVFWSSLAQHLRRLQETKPETTQATASIKNGISVESHADSAAHPHLTETTAMHAMVEQELERRGLEGAIALLERSSSQNGFRPTNDVAILLAAGVTKPSQVKKIQAALNIPLDAQVWARAIEAAAHAHGSTAAFDMYVEGKASGVLPTSEMVLPLLRMLSEMHTPSSSQKAIQLYQELTRNPNCVPSPAVFDILLRLLTKSIQPASMFPHAITLLKDMARFQVAFQHQTATSLLILLIRSAPSHDAAYEIYSLFTEQYIDVLDPEGCDAVLAAFSKLSFIHQKTTPTSLFFMMLNDMRRNGYNLTKKAYTTLLAHIANSCTTEEDAASRRHALESVQQVHQRLLLDSGLSPDTALLNALMNAYNRAGSPVEAMRVWETLYIQGKFDNGSVSVVLDTLNFAGAVDQAAILITKLHKGGFPLDRNNWQSWIELLCRAGKVDEACRLLCFDMQHSRHPMTPDQEHIAVLLKYAWNAGKRSDIQKRIRKAFPTIWSTLSVDLKS